MFGQGAGASMDAYSQGYRVQGMLPTLEHSDMFIDDNRDGLLNHQQ